MIRYEIREICGDWGIYEVRETETEGGERCLLILNSRANAEYVKAILEHESRYPNAAVPYHPEVADMSDEECVAVFKRCVCDADGYKCSTCPVNAGDSLEPCFLLERRVLEMAEKYLERKRAPTVGYADTSLPEGGLEACKWISVDERLPDDYFDYIVVVKHKYQWEDEWQYDVDMGYLGIDDGEIDHLWNTYNDWNEGEECHVTHWMPLPEPPMMKGEGDG